MTLSVRVDLSPWTDVCPSRSPQVRVPSRQRGLLRELRHRLGVHRKRHGPAPDPRPAPIHDPSAPGALGRGAPERQEGEAARPGLFVMWLKSGMGRKRKASIQK